MGLRISVSRTGPVCTVQVDGDLAREGLPELTSVLSSCEGAMRFDLTGLLSLDAQAVAALRALMGGGAEIVGASPYIALLIGPIHRPARRERIPDPADPRKT